VRKPVLTLVVAVAAALPLSTSLGASLGTAQAAPVSRAGSPAPAYQEYVALGDSWSADVVIADTDGPPDSTYAPTGCAQSHRNYPKLLAAALEVPVFRDATCGSATTDDFYAPQTGLPTGETNPPQFDRLTRTTDLVTVGIGGNDAGFAGAAMDCISPLPQGAQCKEKYTAGGTDQLAQRIAESEPKLVRALKEIHKRSPKARILMLDYLAGIPETGCYPVVPVSDSDMAYLYATFQKLNAMVKRAAAAGGAELVDTYTPSLGHHVCAAPTDRYVEGLGIVSVNGVAVAVPAHPNSAGAASQFRSTLAAVQAGR
jgi:lysophospholipase L1-like esterase